MSDLFNTETEISNKFIIDIEKIKNDVYSKAKELLTKNKDSFSKDWVISQPEYSWLKNVKTVLFSPTSENIEDQRKQILELVDNLKKTCTYLLTEHLPNVLPENYNEPILGFDTETTGLDARTMYDLDGNLNPQSLLVGISIAPTENEGYYLPVRHTQEDGKLNWNIEIISEFLDLLNSQFCLIIHNAIYDRQIIALNGCTKFREFPYFFDTQILYYLLNTDTKRYGLKPLSESLLERKMIDIWDMFPKEESNDFIRFDFLSASNAYIYACSDATNTLFLFKKLFENTEPTNPLFFQPKPIEIDHKFIDSLISMNRHGFPIDVFYCINALKDLILRVKLLEQEIYKIVGKEFDIGSGKQLSLLIFNEMKIPPIPGSELNKNGYYSVDEAALTTLQNTYPELKFLEYIVTHRYLIGNISKFHGKFIKNSYLDSLHPYTRGMLSFSLTRVPTGRLASSSNGGLESVEIKEGKKAMTYKFVGSSGDIGVNSQAIPSQPYILDDANLLGEVPEEIQQMSNDLDKYIEVDFYRTLGGKKASIE